MEKIVILNNIRSSENVGSIFRTADAAKVSKIILCGYTPAPIDRFGRENKSLAKASLGAEKFVKWEREENLKKAIENIRSNSANSILKKAVVVGVEQSKDSINYSELKKVAAGISRLALVFGNEVEGLSKEDLELCDAAVEIPMRGSMIRQADHPCNTKQGKESLNVAVSAGIILFELAD